MAVAGFVVSVVALVASVVVAFKQHGQAKVSAKNEGRMLAIEETRFQWDQEAHDLVQRTEQEEQDLERSALFGVSFGFRDSARTWGRVIARNDGPADAHDVSLTIGATVNGEPTSIEPVGGTDYGRAPLVRAGESVHVGVAFAFGLPGAEDLTYVLGWTDQRGPQRQQGRVPLD